MDGLMPKFSDNFGHTFRYFLPGLVIIVLSYIAKPDLFATVDWTNAVHVSLLSILAFVVGNVWNIFHRLVIYELLILIMYVFNQGYFRQPTRYYPDNVKRQKTCCCVEWAIKKLFAYPYAHGRFNYLRRTGEDSNKGFAKDLSLRVAFTHFAFICSEALILIPPFLGAPNYHKNGLGLCLVILGAIGFVSAIFTHYIYAHMYAEIAEKGIMSTGQQNADADSAHGAT